MYWSINKQTTRLWLVPIIALAFALRLYRLDVQSLWFDEIVIVALARIPWYQGLLAALGQGVQLTPVFHGIIKLWLTVGDSDWLVRVPAVLFSMLTIPLVFKLGQLYFNDKAGLLAAFIFAINPYQIWYAQELKLYALLPFVGGGAMYAFGLMVKTRGRRGVVLLTLFNLIGLPAHYFMFLISAVQFLYLVITFRRTHILLRRWLLAQVIGVLPLLLWWLFIFWQQYFSFGIGWIPAPRWDALFLTFWNFTYVYTGQWSIITVAALLVAVVGLILGLYNAWRKSSQGILLVTWLFFPPLITYFMSFGRTSFYVDRYFLIVSPILILLIVSGLLSLRYPLLQWGGIAVFVVVAGLGLWRIYFDSVDFSKEDWRSLAQAVDTQAESDHIVITCTDGHRLSFEYYNPHKNLEADDIIFSALVDNIPESKQVIWIVDVHPRLSAHYLSKTTPPILDESLLSQDAVGWQQDNLQTTVIVAGISAYRYKATEFEHLPHVVAWHCDN